MIDLTIAGWVSIPLSSLDEFKQFSIKDELLYVSKFVDDNGKRKTIKLYDEDEKNLYVPREWARKNLKSYLDDEFTVTNNWVDEEVTPFYTKLPSPDHPSVPDPVRQKIFMEELESKVRDKKNVLAVAQTGAGKTPVSLYVAAKLNRRILVLVNRNTLRDQWINQIQNLLGVPSEMIATIQGAKYNLEGKMVAVGLLQSFARRKYPQEVYDFASVVIIDEAHNISTEFFAQVIPKIRAKYRIALSATPTRKDGADIVLYYHCGIPRVISESRVMDIDVYVKTFTPSSMWGDNDRTQIFHLSRLKDRNRFLTNHIVDMYNDNRKILAVSHSVDHLDKIRDMLLDANINHDDIGYFTGSINENGKRRPTKKAEREYASTKRIILGTYGAIKEGVDIPLIDAGIDLSPNYRATQVIGRARRYVKGKRKPIWITVVDDTSLTSLKTFKSRKKEYQSSGAKIIDS